MLERIYTAIGSPNIAFVKYWGRRVGTARNLPGNSSVSMTLDYRSGSLATITSVIFSKKFRKDRFYIGGKLQDNPKGGVAIVNDLRKRVKVKARVLVVSYNAFPSSSGIASSASGAATLAYVSAKALGLRMSDRDLSIVARESGSACRSVLGGFVLWKAGKAADGKDSYAVQVAKESEWPDLVDLICIVSKSEKKVSSDEGHERAVKTSLLYPSRSASAESNARLATLAIRARDFRTLAEIIMRDSDSMHAIMLDSWPPIRYMTDLSWKIVETINALNSAAGRYIAAYTFDAGPNAHIITTRSNLPRVKRSLRSLGLKELIESGPGIAPMLLNNGAMDLIDQKLLKPKRIGNLQSLFGRLRVFSPRS